MDLPSLSTWALWLVFTCLTARKPNAHFTGDTTLAAYPPQQESSTSQMVRESPLLLIMIQRLSACPPIFGLTFARILTSLSFCSSSPPISPNRITSKPHHVLKP